MNSSLEAFYLIPLLSDWKLPQNIHHGSEFFFSFLKFTLLSQVYYLLIYGQGKKNIIAGKEPFKIFPDLV